MINAQEFKEEIKRDRYSVDLGSIKKVMYEVLLVENSITYEDYKETASKE